MPARDIIGCAVRRPIQRRFTHGTFGGSGLNARPPCQNCFGLPEAVTLRIASSMSYIEMDSAYL